MMSEVVFLGEFFKVVTHNNRPWVIVEQLCRHLGIDYSAQVKRLKKHQEKNGLEIMELEDGGVCLPLEELSWWLRTLRPKNDDAKKKLVQCKKAIVLHLMYEWAVNTDGYGYAHDTRKRVRDAVPLEHKNPPPRRRGVTKEMAEQMKDMHKTKDMSYRIIGAHFGYSAATVCLVVNDKYPVALK